MKQKRCGLVIVLSAPSGCGKTTVEKALLRARKNLKRSVSTTTREKRRGELHGRDYFFVTEESFLKKKKKKAFLESARVFGNYYGTPRAYIEKVTRKGDDVLLTIDVQGAAQVRRKLKEALYIFLLPPSVKELERRLRSRKTDSSVVINKRLGEAKRELAEADHYDYLVVNKTVKEAVKTINEIINAEKHKTYRMKEVIRGLRTA